MIWKIASRILVIKISIFSDVSNGESTFVNISVIITTLQVYTC